MWKKYKLSEIGIIVGGATPSTAVEKYYGGDIPWLTPRDLSSYSERYIERGERNITEDGLKSCSAKLLPKNSVLFSSRAPIGYIVIARNEIATNQGFKSIIPNDNTDALFLYYLLTFNKKNIEAMGSGTTFKEVSGATMKNIEVLLPELDEQKRIAGILGSLDDKIELNNKINANLEEQAQALFKRWFVDFEFPDQNGNPYKSSGGELIDSELGQIPLGWTVGTLSDIVTVKYGKDHKKLEDGSIPVYGSGGVMRYADKSLYESESVLIPRKGTLGNIIYINEPFWSVDTMFYTEMKMDNIAKFVYFFMQSQDLVAMNAGSAVPSMTTEILNKLVVVIPQVEKLRLFEDIANPIFKTMQNNILQNKNIAEIRNTLLPKLMNNQIKLQQYE